MYELLFAQTIGASHIRRNIPCQDYGLVDEKDDYKLFVLSDGHGDVNCIRSDRGAKFICETVRDILPTFINSVKEDNNLEALYQLDKNLLKQLSASIIGNWLYRIEDDIAEDPITDNIIRLIEENTGRQVKYAKEYLNNIRCERAYGCTIIAGVITEEFLFLLQHGDGRCILIDNAGKIKQPVPWDDRCVGAMTTSCCDKDAIESIRYAIVDIKQNKPIACFLSSDGVEDSYASIEATYSFFLRKLIYTSYNGVEGLKNELGKSLPDLSAEGSADDITICGIIDAQACDPFIKQFENYAKKIDLQDALRLTDDNIKSILTGGLYNHLRKEYENAKTRLLSLEAEYEELCATRDGVIHDIQLCVETENADPQITDIKSFVNYLLTRIKRVPVSSFQNNSIRHWVDKINKVLDRISQLEEEREKAKQEVDRCRSDFEKLDLEYQGYCKTKTEIEKQISQLSSQ